MIPNFDQIQRAWWAAQRFALLAMNAEREDERVMFLKLCESWEKTARVLQTIHREKKLAPLRQDEFQ